MTSLAVPISVLSCFLIASALRRRVRRSAERLETSLAGVEAASALVMADWPDWHIADRLEHLRTMRIHRSSVYKQGLHSASSRAADYALLERIGRAEKRLQRAQELQRRSSASADQTV